MRCETRTHTLLLPSFTTLHTHSAQNECGAAVWKNKHNKCTTGQSAACNKHVVRTIALKHTPCKRCVVRLHVVAETCNVLALECGENCAQLGICPTRSAAPLCTAVSSAATVLITLSNSLSATQCTLHSVLCSLGGFQRALCSDILQTELNPSCDSTASR